MKDEFIYELWDVKFKQKNIFSWFKATQNNFIKKEGLQFTDTNVYIENKCSKIILRSLIKRRM